MKVDKHELVNLIDVQNITSWNWFVAEHDSHFSILLEE